ncbi:MAG: polysaccharide lyase [Akkermansiaceae bacterium]
MEQYAKLNTPGKKDGILRGWVDGKLAFENTNVRMRKTPTIKIQNIWINLYHGGGRPASSEDHLYIDDIVVSRKPIGPRK